MLSRIFMTRSLIFLGIIIILTALFFLSFRSGTHLPSPKNPTPSISVSPSLSQTIAPTRTKDPDEIVQSFYTWYLSCSKSGAICNYWTQPHVDAEKINSLLQKTKEYNPIFCSKDVPSSLHVDHSIVGENGVVSVYLVESYPGNKETQVIVDVATENNTQQIVNITCPQI